MVRINVEITVADVNSSTLYALSEFFGVCEMAYKQV